MIAITKSPTKDEMNKKYYSINYCTIFKNTKKIKLEKTAFYSWRFSSPSSRLTEVVQND